jgi:uncharacterized protein (DUF697 family)
MAIPLDLRDLIKSGSKLQNERQQPVAVAVVIEADADDGLIDALRERLRPQTAGATLRVEVATAGSAVSLRPADAVIGVAGSGGSVLAEALRASRQGNVPIVVLALGDERLRMHLADALAQPLADLIVADDAVEVTDVRLSAWLADELGSKRLALAHNFPFMRKAVANEAVRATAVQNGLVGAVAFFPGADMPIMTANQAKMLLQIAAAYGEKLGTERLRELAAVIGGAFAMRTVARQVLGLVPVLGWAVKGGIGYAGTIAMGKAAVEYFEDGADITEVARRIRDGAGDLAKQLPRVRKNAPALTEAPADDVQPQLPGISGTSAEVGTAGE